MDIAVVLGRAPYTASAKIALIQAVRTVRPAPGLSQNGLHITLDPGPADIVWSGPKGVHNGAGRKASPVRSEEARVGARVRVRPGYRKPELRGAIGTIAKLWGAPNYAAVEVRLDGGKSELFWRHEVDEIRKEAREGAFARLS